MSTIETIIKAFKAFPTDGSEIALNAKTFDLDFTNDVFEFLLLQDTLTFKTTTVTVTGETSATLKGTTSVYGYDAVPCTLSFEVKDALVVAKITSDLGKTANIQLPVLFWITTTGLSFAGTMTETKGLPTFGFAGGLDLGNDASAPVAIDYQSAGNWDLGIAKDEKTNISGSQVAAILGGEALSSLLPESLEKELDTFAVSSIDASFNSKTHFLSYFNVGFEVVEGWDITSDLSLEPGMGLSFTLSEKKIELPKLGATAQDVAATSDKNIAAQVTGTLKLGGVDVPLILAAAFNDVATWEFGVQAGKTVTIPSLKDVLLLGGDQAFVDSLPAQISTLPSIEIDRLFVIFQPSKKLINEVSFKVQTASTWQVLPGYFELTKVKLDFDITDVNTPKDRKVVGEAYAGFDIGDVPFFCQIKNTKKDQDWVITGGLVKGSKLNFTAIAASLFNGELTIPKDAPQIAFDKANLEVVPEKKTFEISAGSDDAWDIITGKLAIETLSIDFSRKPEKKKAGEASQFEAKADAPDKADPPSPTTYTYSGQISGTLTIGGVAVSLSAVLNKTPDSGIDFEGSTGDQKIPFGNWLQDFASFFGPVELPHWVTELTLSDIAVTYNSKTKDFSFAIQLSDNDAPGLIIALSIEMTHKDKDWTKVITTKLTYKDDDVDLLFSLAFTTSEAKGVKTSNTRAVWGGDNPPSLATFLIFMGKTLKLDVDFPQAVNWDATLSRMIIEGKQVGTKPQTIEAAGQFDLKIDGNTDWSLFFSYTNETSFEDGGDKESAGKLTVYTSDDAEKSAPEADPTPEAAPYVFGIALSGPMNLTDLPLVGSIPGIDAYNIDKLGFYYTNAAFKDDKAKLNFTIPDLDSVGTGKAGYSKAQLDKPKFNLLALFAKDAKGGGGDKAALAAPDMPEASSASGDSDGSMSLGTPTPDATADQPGFAKTQSSTDAPIAWLALNKSIGPVSLEKVGLSYSAPPKGEDGELGIFGVYLNGGLSIASFSMALDGLGITFPLPKPGGSIKDPISQIDFHLNGLFLDLEEPGFKIAGGFIKIPGDTPDMIGQLTVDAGPFGLDAYGGFAGDLSDPSVFIFLHLTAPLGGPPFFFVDGVSGGFGLNRDFVLPTFDQLGNYPLLPQSPAIPTAADMGGKSAADKLKTMQTALLSLAKYFPVKEGQYWVAAGLDITSFEMIKVSVILSVSFGKDLQVAVIGSAGMSLPVNVGTDPMAYIQINFLVSYSSSNSLVSVIGVITPSSFILTKEIKLSGGFAFYLWLDGPNSGDFVLTIGGYSPFYNKPALYPDVPRMSLSASIGILSMKGESYFALVPSALMAGIDVKATADLGPISAWFHASADFFIGWKPFTYHIQIGIALGASLTLDIGFVTIRITIHVGVGLDIWGPEFGGRAMVDLSIVSFAIDFGKQKQEAPVLTWSEFIDFLPSKTQKEKEKAAPLRMAPMMAFALMEEPNVAVAAPAADTGPKTLISVEVARGKLAKDQAAADASGVAWVVNGNDFAIRTHASAPSNAINFNNEPLPQDTARYLLPGNLRQQFEERPELIGKLPYIIDPKPPEGAPIWYDLEVGVKPSNLTDLTSTQIITLKNEAGDDQAVMLQLVKSGVASALWGSDGDTSTSDSGLMAGAVVGIEMLPNIYFPKRTSYIQYYYLVFSPNDVFIAQEVAPSIDTGAYPDPGKIIDSMKDGTAFSSTETARTDVVDVLGTLGFDDLAPKNSGALSTQDYVQSAELMHMTAA
ncbi:DUF6603 domain-containing protein [uncultured Tateyamaria sp.]|uniref:DUF6603 domain-containing protein n=1 Tax=uncultured Tateyamaria sp. TaxID=455651 RepID=UPI00261E1F86|nr:DUF6603 domain-containing protein [uncultured Tateyamaria sp.]